MYCGSIQRYSETLLLQICFGHLSQESRVASVEKMLNFAVFVIQGRSFSVCTTIEVCEVLCLTGIGEGVMFRDVVSQTAVFEHGRGGVSEEPTHQRSFKMAVDSLFFGTGFVACVKQRKLTELSSLSVLEPSMGAVGRGKVQNLFRITRGQHNSICQFGYKGCSDCTNFLLTVWGGLEFIKNFLELTHHDLRRLFCLYLSMPKRPRGVLS